ncbi:MAG: hypothetical protein ABI548_14405 [Polyangiaceae bacterium]
MRALHFAIALLFTGCSNGGAGFTTQTAAGFVPASHTISVLGVYKDGRMVIGNWEKLAPHLVQALGPAHCDVGFDSLVTSNQELANAIDEYARGEGPSSALLTKLAPAARGDMLMVITFAGRPPDQTERGPTEAAPVPTGMGSQRKRHRSPNGGVADPDRLDISASLFSVKANHTVALVSMSYGGENVEGAMTRFGAELARSIPHSKCVGWDWNANVTPTTLRTTDLQ